MSDIPAKPEELKPGVRVKVIHPTAYGRTGILKNASYGNHYGLYEIQYDDDGSTSNWGYADSFSLLENQTEIDLPATLEQLQPGVRVKCIYKTATTHPFYLQTGEVISAEIGIIRIKWDNGADDCSGWCSPDSFTVISSKQATAPTTIVDNYTCTLCGNKKLCTYSDKSCWSCGEPLPKN
jgi:hypothetical protein